MCQGLFSAAQYFSVPCEIVKKEEEEEEGKRRLRSNRKRNSFVLIFLRLHLCEGR
jgi:hypothetical protein